MRRPTVIVGAALLALGTGAPAVAAPGGNGTVRVTIAAPSGVPATVTLVGKTRPVATKAPAGTSTLVSLSVPAGRYGVSAPGLVFGGRRYVAKVSRPALTVGRGGKTAVTVAYSADGAARDLHAAAVTASSVNLSWTAPPGAS